MPCPLSPASLSRLCVRTEITVSLLCQHRAAESPWAPGLLGLVAPRLESGETNPGEVP